MISVLSLGLLLFASAQQAAFEVATIKPTPPDFRGRYSTMQGAQKFIARGYTLKFMVATAYNLPPRLVSGGPDWIETVAYDIDAATPGARPTIDEQMAMLRSLLSERFNLTFHREQKEMQVYELTVAKDGSRLRESAAPAEEVPLLVNRVFPGRIELPARNVTMPQFAAMMQRTVFDRPVLDKTGLAGRYDFDLEWMPDDAQFGGMIPPPNADTPQRPDLYAAMQQQLGLRLQATRGMVDVIVIDRVDRPSEN